MKGSNGGAGSNTLYGGDGNDYLVTTNIYHSEVWYGGAGDDWLGRPRQGTNPDAAAESDTFYGKDGDDRFVLEGNAEGDIFYGGDGKDYFGLHGEVVGSGKHLIYCGRGYDTVTYDSTSRQDLVTHDCEKVRRG